MYYQFYDHTNLFLRLSPQITTVSILVLRGRRSTNCRTTITDWAVTQRAWLWLWLNSITTLVASRSRELRVLVWWRLPVAVVATIVIPASRIVLHIIFQTLWSLLAACANLARTRMIMLIIINLIIIIACTVGCGLGNTLWFLGTADGLRFVLWQELVNSLYQWQPPTKMICTNINSPLRIWNDKLLWTAGSCRPAMFGNFYVQGVQ